MIRLPFFIERLLEQIRVIVVAKLARVSAYGSVAGHLVMLNVLRLVDQTGVQNIRIGIFFDQFVTFLDQAFHANAFLAAWAYTEIAADLLETLRVHARFLEVSAEGFLQLWIVCSLG